MQGFEVLFADDLEIGLPHFRADGADGGNDLLAHGGEGSLEGFDGSCFAHPEQSGDAPIDLVDQGEVLVALGVLDFIDADDVDLDALRAPFLPKTKMQGGSKYPGPSIAMAHRCCYRLFSDDYELLRNFKFVEANAKGRNLHGLRNSVLRSLNDFDCRLLAHFIG